MMYMKSGSPFRAGYVQMDEQLPPRQLIRARRIRWAKTGFPPQALCPRLLLRKVVTPRRDDPEAEPAFLVRLR